MQRVMILHELRDVCRDPGTRCVLGVFFVVLIVNCIVSEWIWADRASVQAFRQSEARSQWLNQTTDGPHQATHEGTTVFKVPSPLAGLDPGLDPELGTSIRVESHRRHSADGLPRGDEVRLYHLNFATPAMMLQTLLPLFIIVISHNRVTREHEMLTLLTSLGVTRSRLFLGKFFSVLAVTMILAAPLVLHLMGITLAIGSRAGMTASALAGRATVLLAVNLLYVVFWCAAGTAASVRCPTAGSSLIVLTALWAVWTMVIPRLAVDLAASREPLPSQQELQDLRVSLLREGDAGQMSLRERNTAIERSSGNETRETQGKELAIARGGSGLIAMEEFTDAVDDLVQSRIAEVHERQNRFVDRFALLSPFLAVRSISTAVAGTDRYHHDAFLNSAERYRRQLVQMMNAAQMQGRRPGATETSRRKFWGEVPDFVRDWPFLTDCWGPCVTPTASLLGWSLILILAAVSACQESHR